MRGSDQGRWGRRRGRGEGCREEEGGRRRGQSKLPAPPPHTSPHFPPGRRTSRLSGSPPSSCEPALRLTTLRWGVWGEERGQGVGDCVQSGPLHLWTHSSPTLDPSPCCCLCRRSSRPPGQWFCWGRCRCSPRGFWTHSFSLRCEDKSVAGGGKIKVWGRGQERGGAMCGMIIVWEWGQEVEAMPVFAEGLLYRTRSFSHKGGMVIDSVGVLRGGTMVWGSVWVEVGEGVDRTRRTCLSAQQSCSPEVQPTIPFLQAVSRSLTSPPCPCTPHFTPHTFSHLVRCTVCHFCWPVWPDSSCPPSPRPSS